jgi:hypothetical protein
VMEVGTSRSRVRGLSDGPCLGGHTRMKCQRCRHGMAVGDKLALTWETRRSGSQLTSTSDIVGIWKQVSEIGDSIGLEEKFLRFCIYKTIEEDTLGFCRLSNAAGDSPAKTAWKRQHHCNACDLRHRTLSRTPIGWVHIVRRAID